jgi:hypothetical protein
MKRELQKNFIGLGGMKGFVSQQLFSTSKGYLYQVMKNGKLIRFDVFERKADSETQMLNYPTLKDLGKWAWRYDTSREAVKKLIELDPNPAISENQIFNSLRLLLLERLKD